jgi:hypothetical protein
VFPLRVPNGSRSMDDIVAERWVESVLQHPNNLNTAQRYRTRLSFGSFRMKRFPLLFAAAALLWMGGSRPASAQSQVFSDRASWSTAAGAVTTRDFEELSDDNLFQTLAYPGVTFSSTDADPQDLRPLSPDSFSFPSLTSRALASNRNFNPLVATFSPAVRAVGLDVVVVPTGGALSVTVETTAGSQQVDVALTDGGPAFIGFVADSGISRVTVANPAGQSAFVCVDNVSYGGSSGGGTNPALTSLDLLKASVEAGIADGSIKLVGRSLLQKVVIARALVVRNRTRPAVLVLIAFKHEVVAGRKKIAPAKVTELLALTDECLKALIPSH